MQIKRFLYLTIALLAFGLHSYPQQAGMPFIRNYPMTEYRAQSQNWGVIQDKRGVMYFANTDGLLEYDGISWQLMRLPVVRCLSMDSAGRIFMGLENDLGYLDRDKDGRNRFVSLKPALPEKYRNLTTVWTLNVVGNRMVFQTDGWLFIYENRQFSLIPAKNYFYLAWAVNGHYYVQDMGQGLFRLDGDTLVLVEGCGSLASDKLRVMVPWRGDELLIITRNLGVAVYSPKNNTIRKADGFEEVNHFLSRYLVNCGAFLGGGKYSCGTMTGGFIMFDSTGRITEIYNKNNGLHDNSIFQLYPDCNGQVWAALDNGISLVQCNLPFRNYIEKSGLNGNPTFVDWVGGKLYIGTSQFLHIQKPDGSFEAITGTAGQCYQMMETNGRILFAHNPGVFEIRNNRAILVPNTGAIPANALLIPREHPDRLLVGAQDGLYLFDLAGSPIRLMCHVAGTINAMYMAQDAGGTIWATNQVDMYRLQLRPAQDSLVTAELCTVEQGLPTTFAQLFTLNSGEVVFGTERGIYRYVPATRKFEPHPDFRILSGKVTVFRQLKNGDIWFEEMLTNGDHLKGRLRNENGHWMRFGIPFLKFTDISCFDCPLNIIQTPDSMVYLGTTGGVLQYNPGLSYSTTNSFKTLIRKVLAKDTLLFGGLPADNNTVIGTGPEIGYSLRDITFHFAATFYENAERNQYSYRLLGSDTAWSAWVSDHKKEYSNLGEGRYLFEVRSMNQYQEHGPVASYAFRILPPWYRTWWAYMVYLLLTVLAVYSLVILRTRRLLERSRALEAIVDQRTTQVQELSRIGRDITASLSIENIIHTVYEHVNKLMDASVFTIGLYKIEENVLEFPAAIEKGQPLPAFRVFLTDQDRPAAWCFNHQQEVIINDYASEYSKYFGQQMSPIAGENPISVLYLPLWKKDKVIGVISAQSFSKDAYSDYQINILRNLAAYTAIALENADAYRRLAVLLDELKSTQEKLITQSKLAALGSLTAGIAHEIKNPLNFVNNFASLNGELAKEAMEEIGRMQLNPEASAELEGILKTLSENSEKIREHGLRADSIVKSMLQHSRTGKGEKQPTDINKLLEEAVNLTYHGMRAQDNRFNIKIESDLDTTIGKIGVIPQDISRVFLNLFGNACYETNRKNQVTGSEYMPAITVSTRKSSSMVEIRVRDNGDGIPGEVRDKLFTPFFTTKPAGQGTGLGLSISYDIIVQKHGGHISFESEEGKFTEFLVELPLSIS